MRAEQIAKLLRDPMWRIQNLYEIKLTTGDIVPYKPRPFQMELHKDCYERGKKRFLVPKSRRQGCSTAIGVMMADMAAFNEGWKLALVDRTQDDATEKLTDIVEVALASLAKKLPNMIMVDRTSKRIKVQMTGGRSSEIIGGKYFRGSGLGFAHISEIGTIATTEPKRAQEIINGTLPAAKDGFIFIETTVRGGKRGVFYDNVMNALKVKEEERTTKDFNVVFLPWWSDAQNVAEGDEELTEATQTYFASLLSRTGIHVNKLQKVWWQKTKRQLGSSMNEEYPSTLEEAFEVPLEGAILEASLDVAMTNGHFRTIPYDATKPCYCTWDLGSPLNTVSLVFQMDGSIINVLEVDCGASQNERPAERVARLRAKFPTLMTNFFPHDGGYMTDTGMSQAQMWMEAGLPGIRMIPKVKDKWVGINYMLGMFDLLRFDKEGTRTAFSYWLTYRSKPNSGEDGAFKNEIVHDASSHWTDPLRYVCEARMNRLIGVQEGDMASGVTKSFGRFFKDRNTTVMNRTRRIGI